MTRWTARLLSVLLILTAGSVLQAQETTPDPQPFDPPLVAYFNGDMYRMDTTNTLIPYNSCQPSEALAGNVQLSPAGTHIAFSTLTKQASQTLQEMGGMGGPLPVNLWLCDMQTDILTRFVVSENADDPPGNESSEFILRGAPVWSPDGSQIAWSELGGQDNQSAFINRYDLTTEEISRTEITLPPTLGIPSPPGITWGENGIYIFVFQLDEETFETQDFVYIFDTDTNSIADQTLIESGGETNDFVAERVRVRQNGQEFLALRYSEAGWFLFNPLTGDRQPAPSLPGLVARNADNSQVLLFDLNEQFNYNWQVQNFTSSNGEPFVLTSRPPVRVALSPDGQRVAYADSTLNIWQNGQTTEVNASDGFADDAQAFVLWGASEVIIAEATDIVPAPLPTCEGAQQSRLHPGDTAQVVASTIPNNVRSNPTIQADRIAQLPGGATFEVIGGPVCSDGYAWYQVALNGEIIGWTAEGNSAVYWLAPVEESN